MPDARNTVAIRADELIRRQPGFFVPNLGQWDHAARFVHRSGPMTLFLEDRGWVLDLVERPAKLEPDRPNPHHPMPANRDVDEKIRGVALKMTFEGDAHAPAIVGEHKFAGHHNYFLGDDESRWRTGVPLYGSVRYENLYPGIDLRVREANGVSEYDLMLRPGADLAAVTVHVEGGDGMSIASDGSLVIATVLGPLTQSVPKTWQVDGDGNKRVVACNFTLLGADRFGFEATGWDGDTSLTIDPGLIWSTILGGISADHATAVYVDAGGMVTVAGYTSSTNFPMTRGAYDTAYNGGYSDAFVSRLDPRKTGTAQLAYSTFLGGSGWDYATALSVDAIGVVTVTGDTRSPDFPTIRGAYDRSNNNGDVFVTRLIPFNIGSPVLVYSSFLGGNNLDYAQALHVDAGGVITLAGQAWSTDFPTTSGAYDSTHNGGSRDVFVSRLDPRKTGAAQLIYSTLLGGSRWEQATALSVDSSGVVTLAGFGGSTDFPTTSGAYDRTHSGDNWDAFVSRLDPSRTGSAQLRYSTFLGGNNQDFAQGIAVDAGGVVTVAGYTWSKNFPTTSNAFDTIFNNGDAFVSRLDPSKTGTAQLVYSTFFGGGSRDFAWALSVDASGVVTVAGSTSSTDFPTTTDAYDTTYNNGDAFVSQLDPSRKGFAQLVYSTFLGGYGGDSAHALFVDASGTVTVAGVTDSPGFPTTSGAYDTTFNGGRYDVFVARLSMGVALYGDVHEISIKAGGTQRLTVNAGVAHKNLRYWIFGSMTGTTPGVNLLGVHIPLNPDQYTTVAMGAANAKEFKRFKGTLDSNGLATASFDVPANLPLRSGFIFHHAYLVYDSSGKVYMASNAVPLRLK